MSVINKKFQTKASSSEMRHFIDTKVLVNPALKPMVDSAAWNGNTLFLSSKLGKGTIHLEDNLVEVNIELNFFGSMAKNTIEATLDKEFKQLNP
ncbi:MAG: polyhydroxyalkanoic acid system family protein [Candidatus Kapabacteria bacterium]|nr:polyhydroxyalkanoic acid system family protein [Ignavibacteriota bacterium]MCW5886157.1 polyhydroxyalkanoic acid system family protein [Candidatus Kapabacteria bacterium]